MTLATMRTAVKTKLRIGTLTDNLLPDPTVTTLVNEALRKFSRERQWPWQLTSASVSVATTGLGTLPTDYVVGRQLMYDSKVVTFVGLDELLSGEFKYVWTDNGVSVMVEPAPSATLSTTLWYYQREEDLSADGDNPIVPAIHQDPIIIWAAHLGAIIRKDYELAAVLASEYDRELSRMADVVFRKKGSGQRIQRRGDHTSLPARW